MRWPARRGASAAAVALLCITAAQPPRAAAQATSSASGPPSVDASTQQALPALRVDLRVTEQGPGRPWLLHLENLSRARVRVVADPRLLRFDVQLPEPPEQQRSRRAPRWRRKPKPPSCQLPSEMVPDGPAEPTVVELEPRAKAVRVFDPRLICAPDGEHSALVPGAVLTPHLGWPRKTRTRWRRGKKETLTLPDTAPFVAAPLASDAAERPVQDLTGASLTLGESYAGWIRATDPKQPTLDPTLRITSKVDARDERSIRLKVSLRNTTSEPLSVYFRRELITFDVIGPDGRFSCDPGSGRRAPSRMAFSSLAPGKALSVSSRVVEWCPRGSFDRPGLYLVYAQYDSSFTGASVGLSAFAGSLRTRRPAVLRVLRGPLPFRVAQPPPEDGSGQHQPASRPDRPDPGSDRAQAPRRALRRAR